MPKRKVAPTAQLLEVSSHYYLIDCGEGTQVQLRKAKAKFSKINQIFISHLHGDHVFGLIGLISSFQLLGRETSLYIYGPKGIQDFIMNQLRHTQSRCSFQLFFTELESTTSEKIFEDKQVEVYTIPLDHRIYTNGFLFREKPKPRKLNIEAIKKYPEIEYCDYENLKQGKDYQLNDGMLIHNSELTFDPPPPRSYAFCSDTRYKPDIVPFIKNVDLLYHESTFLSDLQEMAVATGHSTAKEAASIAREADVGRLILGHFSNRYEDLSVMLEEAKTVFKNTILPIPLGVYELDQQEEEVEVKKDFQ